MKGHHFERFICFPDGLARVGNAPAIFARTSRSGLPYVSILACASLSFLAYMGIKATPGKVFGWFANSTHSILASIFCWMLSAPCSDVDGWALELVLYLRHLHSVLRRPEGTTHGPDEAPVLLAVTTFRGVVRCCLLLPDLLRELNSHSLPGFELTFPRVCSSAAGLYSSKTIGTQRASSPTIFR